MPETVHHGEHNHRVVSIILLSKWKAIALRDLTPALVGGDGNLGF